jgi:hypothetical protein
MTDIRSKSRAFLTSTLETLASDSNTANEQAAAIEGAVYEKYNGDTGNEYRNELRSLSLNLGKDNPDLGKRVASGEVSAEALISMSPDVSSSERMV